MKFTSLLLSLVTLVVVAGGMLFVACRTTSIFPAACQLLTPLELALSDAFPVAAPRTTPYSSVSVSTRESRSAVLSPSPVIAFVGPRENIASDTPSAYGFWSFAMPVSGVFSRSGQPLFSEFQWLKQQGWRGVIDLRVDGERGEVGDDAKISGFKELGFQYLYLPLTDGHPPTDAEAVTYLAFVTNPANQPVHTHCRGGIGRAGTMTALYRYAVQGWPMEAAISESRAFRGGVSELQQKWLNNWAATHSPRSHALK